MTTVCPSNITPDQFTLLLGRRYNRAKKAQGGTGANQHVAQTGQIVQSASTAQKLAEEHGVDERTVNRFHRLNRFLSGFYREVSELCASWRWLIGCIDATKHLRALP